MAAPIMAGTKVVAAQLFELAKAVAPTWIAEAKSFRL